MRTETSEALGRLVSIFVAAIEGAGEVIPDSAIEQLATDPLGTCEKLNELALSCGAIDEGVDAALAAVYESMDAADARGAVDEQCVGSVVTAWANTHVERPVEEPEPEPEPSEAAEAEKDEQAEKPKRRRNRKAKDQRSEAEAGNGSPEPESAQDAPAEQPESEKSADVKPGRRSRAKAKEQAEKDKGTEKPKRGKKRAEKAAEEQAETSKAPKPEASEDKGSAPEPDAPAPAATQDDGDTLSVDQATAILGVSRPTIYKLIESGELPAHKKGRSWRISAAAVTERASK